MGKALASLCAGQKFLPVDFGVVNLSDGTDDHVWNGSSQRIREQVNAENGVSTDSSDASVGKGDG